MAPKAMEGMRYGINTSCSTSFPDSFLLPLDITYPNSCPMTDAIKDVRITSLNVHHILFQNNLLDSIPASPS